VSTVTKQLGVALFCAAIKRQCLRGTLAQSGHATGRRLTVQLTVSVTTLLWHWFQQMALSSPSQWLAKTPRLDSRYIWPSLAPQQSAI